MYLFRRRKCPLTVLCSPFSSSWMAFPVLNSGQYSPNVESHQVEFSSSRFHTLNLTIFFWKSFLCFGWPLFYKFLSRCADLIFQGRGENPPIFFFHLQKPFLRNSLHQSDLKTSRRRLRICLNVRETCRCLLTEKNVELPEPKSGSVCDS